MARRYTRRKRARALLFEPYGTPAKKAKPKRKRAPEPKPRKIRTASATGSKLAKPRRKKYGPAKADRKGKGTFDLSAGVARGERQLGLAKRLGKRKSLTEGAPKRAAPKKLYRTKKRTQKSAFASGSAASKAATKRAKKRKG
jgi:hypothetical protein